ncbi:MAG TPA: TetR/AcrR family transcriptional regulator [Acidimicrobiales bacterium]
MSADGARRTDILETAERLFASSGLRTSLKEIADACGILPGSLYHHFESKEAIIVELIERYRAELDDIAARALDELQDAGPESVAERIVALSSSIAECAVRHRAAVLLTFYEPPSGASDELVRVVRGTPAAIEKAMLETLRLGRASGDIRSSIDLEALADRFCTTTLSVFPGVPGTDQLPAIRCRILLDGIAAQAPSDGELDRSAAFRAAQKVVETWDAPAAPGGRAPRPAAGRGPHRVRPQGLRGHDRARHRNGGRPGHRHRLPADRLQGRAAAVDHGGLRDAGAGRLVGRGRGSV